MKFVWSSVLCLLVIHASAAFKDLFKPPSHDRPSLLDIITKPKIPGVNIQIGSQAGSGMFGFGFGFGVNRPPKDNKNHGKPDYPGTWEEEKKDKHGPRPNWGEDKGGYPKPGPYDNDKHPRPGSYDNDKHPRPGSYDDDYPKHEDSKKDYPKPGSFDDNKEYPKRDEKDSLPDWEDVGEMDSKSESLMDKDLVGDELIQPRLNRRRSKRFIESRVFHVPLTFRSNAKPYRVKIQSNPNRLRKRYSED